jgi:hypothetical protein
VLELSWLEAIEDREIFAFLLIAFVMFRRVSLGSALWCSWGLPSGVK